MRFAGSKIAGLLGDKPNYDELGSQGVVDAAKGVANTALNNARAADATMRSQAEVLAAEANADAIAAQGQAAATSTMANDIGSAISGFAGTFGKMGGFGGGIGRGADFGEVGTSGSDMAAMGYTPEQDRLFNSGEGIDYGYL